MCRVLCEHKFSNHWGKYQGTSLLKHMVRLCLVWEETAKLSFNVAVPFCTPTSSEWELLLLHIFIIIWCYQWLSSSSSSSSVWDFSHSKRWVMASHCFYWQFPWVILYDVEHIFICLFVICISSLVMCLCRSLAHLNWVVFLLSTFLYILDKVAYWICVLQIFSLSLWLVFSFFFFSSVHHRAAV